jgi:predicted acyl esterase
MKTVTRFLVLIFLLAGGSLFGQLDPEVISIPMRDGEELAAHLYRPNDTDAFPVILIQTPYNKAGFQLIGLPLGVDYDISSSDYAFVVVDWRCFFGSLPACTLNPNRGEDGYDAVEWIAAQPWSNGKIGTWGPSALGGVQFSTAYEQPPHLICAVPEVAAPWETYHKYYPGGSIKVEQLETLQTLFGNYDLVINNPYYNLLWQIAENTTMRPEDVGIPMLLVAGWFDHNTEWDMVMIDTLASASPLEVRDQHKILIGPWVHGGVGPASVGTEQQGELSFPEATNGNDLLAKEFFDFYLRDIGNDWTSRDRYIYFQMGENTWEETDVWPPEGGTTQTFYLRENGFISTDMSTSDEQLSFTYDPEDPSPTIGGKTLNPDLLQGPFDQGPEVESRNDVLIFSTPILTEALPVQGKVKAQLFVSSDRIDTDVVLRLTEVYPDGRSILIGESIQRLRFREGYTMSDEAFMTPGEVYPVTLSFEDFANTFQVGNQLRLIVSSSNYPRYNRNMNTGGEMYPNGEIDVLVNPLVAENTLYLSAAFPSNIELPIAGISSNLSEKDLFSGINMAPNPVRDHLLISANGYSWDGGFIVDMKGIKRLELSAGRDALDLNVEDLPPGMYSLQLFTEYGTFIKKIIKL